jgi:hypothetical protein
VTAPSTAASNKTAYPPALVKVKREETAAALDGVVEAPVLVPVLALVLVPVLAVKPVTVAGMVAVLRVVAVTGSELAVALTVAEPMLEETELETVAPTSKMEVSAKTSVMFPMLTAWTV